MQNLKIDTKFILVIDNCKPPPCINGVCENQIGDYKCKCTPGYTGRNCETSKILVLYNKYFTFLQIFYTLLNL